CASFRFVAPLATLPIRYPPLQLAIPLAPLGARGATSGAPARFRGALVCHQAGKGEGPPASPAGLHGGAKRSRTADLLNAIQALYQLSYSPRGLWVSVGRPPERRGT